MAEWVALIVIIVLMVAQLMLNSIALYLMHQKIETVKVYVDTWRERVIRMEERMNYERNTEREAATERGDEGGSLGGPSVGERPGGLDERAGLSTTP